MLIPLADVFLQSLDGLVCATAQLFVGEEPEPAFDLVEPGGTGWREVQVEAGVDGELGGDRNRATRTRLTPTSASKAARRPGGTSGHEPSDPRRASPTGDQLGPSKIIRSARPRIEANE